MEGKAEAIRHKSSGKKASGCETVPKSPNPNVKFFQTFATYKQVGANKTIFRYHVH